MVRAGVRAVSIRLVTYPTAPDLPYVAQPSDSSRAFAGFTGPILSLALHFAVTLCYIKPMGQGHRRGPSSRCGLGRWSASLILAIQPDSSTRNKFQPPRRRASGRITALVGADEIPGIVHSIKGKSLDQAAAPADATTREAQSPASPPSTVKKPAQERGTARGQTLRAGRRASSRRAPATRPVEEDRASSSTARRAAFAGGWSIAESSRAGSSPRS